LIVYGINPVLEALRAGRVKALWTSGRDDERMRQLLAFAATHGLAAQRVAADVLTRKANGGVHQGVVADVDDASDYSVADLVRSARDVPLILVLDGIEDPHNIGAILRSADATGVDGVVVQSRRSAARSAVAAKASSGAVAHVKVAEVVNVARALEELKELGVWTIGLAGEARTPYDGIDFTIPTAIVLGAEGPGLRRLVRERCDRLVAIPMQGHVGSVNVSVAAGVVLFEAVRQRRNLRASPIERGGAPSADEPDS
jgi:23S rRNA (guanosine2251-2'-O)-methyltransferase